MEDKYGMIRQHSGIWRSLRDGDFEEEEVWDVLRDRNDHRSSEIPRSKVVPSSSPIPVPRPLPKAARMIPRASSSTSSSHETHVVLQQSAPVNIPDWSKIHSRNHKNNKKTSQNDDYGFDDDDEEEEEEEDDEFDVRLPPHEVIARRLARSQISSFSVFEGVGRTLKGRDLSKVRNAILTKTGFLESL